MPTFAKLSRARGSAAALEPHAVGGAAEARRTSYPAAACMAPGPFTPPSPSSHQTHARSFTNPNLGVRGQRPGVQPECCGVPQRSELPRGGWRRGGAQGSSYPRCRLPGLRPFTPRRRARTHQPTPDPSLTRTRGSGGRAPGVKTQHGGVPPRAKPTGGGAAEARRTPVPPAAAVQGYGPSTPRRRARNVPRPILHQPAPGHRGQRPGVEPGLPILAGADQAGVLGAVPRVWHRTSHDASRMTSKSPEPSNYGELGQRPSRRGPGGRPPESFPSPHPQFDCTVRAR